MACRVATGCIADLLPRYARLSLSTAQDWARQGRVRDISVPSVVLRALCVTYFLGPYAGVRAGLDWVDLT
jgi:hypothetical protein